MNFQSETCFLGHQAANYPISMISNSSIASYEFSLENFSKQSLKIWLFVNHLIDLQVFIALFSLNTKLVIQKHVFLQNFLGAPFGSNFLGDRSSMPKVTDRVLN